MDEAEVRAKLRKIEVLFARAPSASARKSRSTLDDHPHAAPRAACSVIKAESQTT